MPRRLFIFRPSNPKILSISISPVIWPINLLTQRERAHYYFADRKTKKTVEKRTLTKTPIKNQYHLLENKYFNLLFWRAPFCLRCWLSIMYTAKPGTGSFHSGTTVSLLLSFFSHVFSVWPSGLQPARLFCPWDSLGKSTRVGCHALLQEIFPTQGLTLVSCICRSHGGIFHNLLRVAHLAYPSIP